jgi:hypothetical protein
VKKKQEKKKRGGQPLPEGQARTERIAERFTENEVAEILASAKARKWKKSRLLREALADYGVLVSRT